MKKISTVIIALALFPALALAAQLKGTVVKIDKAKKQMVLQSDKGEETLEISAGTKGIEHAKEGAKVTVTYSGKDGQLRVSEIAPDSE